MKYDIKNYLRIKILDRKYTLFGATKTNRWIRIAQINISYDENTNVTQFSVKPLQKTSTLLIRNAK